MMKDVRNYSLLEHNTFGIAARCRRFLEYASVEEARQVAAMIRNDCSPGYQRGQTVNDEPLLIIGAGSNLLLTGDFPGIVVHSAIMGREVITAGSDVDPEAVLLRVGSGENWDEVVDYCVAQGWYGAENLSLIPGEAGASAVQNIGAYGVEAHHIIYKVEAVGVDDGMMHTFTAAECGYGYRQSRFKREWKNKYLITHVTYRLSKVFTPHLDYGNIRQELERRGIAEPTARQLREVIMAIRREKLPDPKVEGNAGSFFMNPVVPRARFEALLADYPQMPHYFVDEDHEKIPAGWLIDQCGWKGRSVGAAGVHARQALVLVNRGGATGADIVRLCEQIRSDVAARFGIDIHPEVNII